MHTDISLLNPSATRPRHLGSNNKLLGMLNRLLKFLRAYTTCCRTALQMGGARRTILIWLSSCLPLPGPNVPPVLLLFSTRRLPLQ